MTNEQYIAQAEEEYAWDGAIEIDDNAVVSRGSDRGAYVQAWVWVEADDEPDDYASEDDPDAPSDPHGRDRVVIQQWLEKNNLDRFGSSGMENKMTVSFKTTDEAAKKFLDLPDEKKDSLIYGVGKTLVPYAGSKAERDAMVFGFILALGVAGVEQVDFDHSLPAQSESAN